MSLFPAYDKNDKKAEPDKGTEDPVEQPGNSKHWQSNSSYNQQKSHQCMDAFSESSSDSEGDGDIKKLNSPVANADKVKVKPLEFDGSVEYCVDKIRNKRLMELQRLPRLSHPLYKCSARPMSAEEQRLWLLRNKRRISSLNKRLYDLCWDPIDSEAQRTNANKLRQRIRHTKTLLAHESPLLTDWVMLHEMIGKNPEGWNRQQVAEQQLLILENGLMHHPSNEKLLQLYVSTAQAAYTDNEVADKIEQLIKREPYVSTLWSALIMATQGSMARCNVSDVLSIYSRAMSRVNNAENRDEEMLKLFHNCVLFLRQSSSTAKMFALLKFTLVLNSKNLDLVCMVANPVDEKPLLDLEEMVLSSGLPMMNIWSRIEVLRQSYNFLPYPQSDPSVFDNDDVELPLQQERIVYSGEVSSYIYPVQNKDNQLLQILMVFQLTKLPFVRTDCLADRLCPRLAQMGDSDAVEMLLASLSDRPSYALIPSKQYTDALMYLAKQFHVCPTIMPFAIAHELYVKCLNGMLVQCIDAFPALSPEADIRQIVILLWFRFQRLYLQLCKIRGLLTPDKVQQVRKQQRDLLKHQHNRLETSFFVELAIFEYEMGDGNIERAAAILEKTTRDLRAQLVYVEMLLAVKDYSKAKDILRRNLNESDSEDSMLKRSHAILHESLVSTARQNLTDDDMPLKEYFMPHELLIHIRYHCLQLCVFGKAEQANVLLGELIDNPIFASVDSKPTRARYLREQLRELQVIFMQLSIQIECPSLKGGTTSQLVEVLKNSLQEFPRNLMFLQSWSMLDSLVWYQLRGQLTQTKAGILSLLHVMISVFSRVSQTQLQVDNSDIPINSNTELQIMHLNNLYKNRLINIFQSFLPSNPHRSKHEAEQYETLRRNSLYWRCYLYCLWDEKTSFEYSKACLQMALDECPWDKALYMYGITNVPQEATHLQDIMIEKQLPIYAFPEELNILRGGHTN